MRTAFAVLLVVAAIRVAAAEQQFVTLRDLSLDSGQSLHCTVGYRTYGTLNERRSNVIVFPTWFYGTTGDLERLGKVGPGLLADPDRYYVITVDALGNGVSCSPSNSDLLSGSGPVEISTADMVRAQYRLLTEGLDIDRVHAILGISMGGMQALRWLEMYPGFMDKVVVVDGSPQMTSYDLLHWAVHKDVVRSLQEAGAPDATIGGVMARLMNLTLYTPDYFIDAVDPNAVDDFLAPTYEPNPAFRADDYVAQLDAMMNHDVLAGDFLESVRRSGVDVLIVSTPSDHMVNQSPARKLAEQIGAATLSVDSRCGHLGSTCESATVHAGVAAFLATEKARR